MGYAPDSMTDTPDTPALRAVAAAGIPHRVVVTEPARSAEER